MRGATAQFRVQLGDANELVGGRLIAGEHVGHGVDIAGQLGESPHDLRDPESPRRVKGLRRRLTVSALWSRAMIR